MAMTSNQQEEFVKLTIDGLVLETGMPAVGFALVQSGLVTKNGLKKMVRKGKIKMVQVTIGKGNINAYYTDAVVPKLLQEREETADAIGREQFGDNQPAGDTSEGLPGRTRDTEDTEEAFRIEEGRISTRQEWEEPVVYEEFDITEGRE